ncbi:MAG: hypothetical protein IJO76_07625 [Clostridia bacterium]|nr:hypothetical protein [Clostridia bacterium]
MDNKKKDRLRRAVRALMLFIAALLLIVALLIPVINNFVAAAVMHDLEALPLPPATVLSDSVSMAGKLSGAGNGMQYFGGVLLQSDLTLEELENYYLSYQEGLFDCRIKAQKGSAVAQIEHESLTFSVDVQGDDWYILYTWGSVPNWAADWLNLDSRGH